MKDSKLPVAVLVRVSTQKQETDRQISELETYATSKGYEIIATEKETISGRADDDERTGLRKVEELARSGRIKKVLVHEISRLARKNSVVHKFVETLEEYGVTRRVGGECVLLLKTAEEMKPVGLERLTQANKQAKRWSVDSIFQLLNVTGGYIQSLGKDVLAQA